MTRAHVYIIGGVPYLHVTRPGGPTESRPMSPAELVGLMEEVAKAVLATCKERLQVGEARDWGTDPAPVYMDDDPPPHYVGAMGE